MTRLITSQLPRSVEIAIAAAMFILPWRGHWSHRSSVVLAFAGLTLAGTQLLRLSRLGSTGGHPRFLARNLDIFIGAMLLAIQYELSEEESSVRGAIAGMGGALMVVGLVTSWVSDVDDRLGDVECG